MNSRSLGSTGWPQRAFLIATLGTILSLLGCGTAKVKVYNFPQVDGFPRKVAVLPFTHDMDLADGDQCSSILRRVFFNYFGYLGYTDMSLDEVDRRLSQAGFNSPNQAADMSMAQLRDALGVDAVVRGHVLGANNFTGGFYAETRIRAALKMIDLKNGHTLWETEHQEWDNSSILTLTVVDTIQSQVENVNVQEAYYKIAESFVLKVIEELPDPAEYREPDIRLPRIQGIRAEAGASDPKSGRFDLVRVDLAGEPGLTATFDVLQRSNGIAMVESLPGKYHGVYRVKPEDNMTDIVIVGRLKNKDGLAGKKVYKASLPATQKPGLDTALR